MKKLLRLALVTSAVLSVGVAVAFAAMPKLGGTYVGGTFKHSPIRITIASKPVKKGVYKGTFSYCGYKVGIFVVKGRFGIWKYNVDFGQKVSIFRGHGGFSDRQHAHGTIDLDFTSNCDGLPGTWTATLK
ncbi:MAG: hypothetical protein ACR2L9_09500 [Solirubrobacteraceae bacterium]|nr:hypothetical protein [Actinomycetota bacterium]